MIDLPEVSAPTAPPGNRLLIAPAEGTAFRIVDVTLVTSYFPPDGGGPRRSSGWSCGFRPKPAIVPAISRSAWIAMPSIPRGPSARCGRLLLLACGRRGADGTVAAEPVLAFTASGEHSPSIGNDSIHGPLAIAGNYAAYTVDYGDEPEGVCFSSGTRRTPGVDWAGSTAPTRLASRQAAVACPRWPFTGTG